MNDKSTRPSPPYTTIGCTRRVFLQSALLGMIAGSTSACHHTLPGNSSGQTADPQWLSVVITDPASAAHLGHSYLMAYPDQRDAGMLLKSIEKAVTKQENLLPQQTDTQQFIDALRRQVRNEYAHDEVVSVAGWVISTTEAHLYALVNMVADAPAAP
jgi:hypothetical protein